MATKIPAAVRFPHNFYGTGIFPPCKHCGERYPGTTKICPKHPDREIERAERERKARYARAARGPMSDYRERMAERRAMGLSAF